MKLTFKDLKQQKFTIEAEPSDTILALKEKIAQEKGWESSSQKLIYSGKILQDQNTVESYTIEEKGFIVCMVSKPRQTAPAASSSSATTPKKAAPSTPVQAPAPAQVSTPSAPAAPVAPAQPTTQNPPAIPSPAGTGAASGVAFNDPSALAMGADREVAIQNMEGMGFERADIDRAMRAAFYNPDRAVEYLLGGIPEHARHEEPAARAPPAQAPRQTQPQTTNPEQPAVATEAETENINLFEAAANAAMQRQQASRTGGSAASLGNLEFLRNNPQFQQLRQVVQQQPHMLEPILQQVSQGNPGLAALINQNQDAFLQLLGETEGDDDDVAPPGAQHIAVTEEERDAIERLCNLGFRRDLVIQAYFAFDKNEELAANFLFDQPDEED